MPPSMSCHWSIDGGAGRVEEEEEGAVADTADVADDDADGIAGACLGLERSPLPPRDGDARADTER